MFVCFFFCFFFFLFFFFFYFLNVTSFSFIDANTSVFFICSLESINLSFLYKKKCHGMFCFQRFAIRKKYLIYHFNTKNIKPSYKSEILSFTAIFSLYIYLDLLNVYFSIHTFKHMNDFTIYHLPDSNSLIIRATGKCFTVSCYTHTFDGTCKAKLKESFLIRKTCPCNEYPLNPNFI